MNQTDWLTGLLVKFADPLINGGISFIITLTVGGILALFFRVLGQSLLDKIIGPIFRAFDHILVNYVAPSTGIAFKKSSHRWICFLGIFLGLTLTATFAPVWFALAAVLVGILAVLAIYRAWEHDEERRQTAEDNGIDPPQGDDLGNEILAGLIFLIVFFTLGFDRVAQQESIYTGAPVFPIATTAAFVWGEILKAVPLVDASEVFGLSNFSGVEATGSVGRSLTFVFRVFLDLLLITSLLRLVAILRRQSSGRDLREVRELLSSDDDASVARAIDELSRFAGAGLLNAQNEFERLALQERDFPKLKQPSTLYRVGLILHDLGERFGSTKFPLLAIEAFRASLEKLSFEATPQQWAHARNGLGMALLAVGRKTGDSNRLTEAIEMFQSVQEIFAREGFEADWANIQNNLGIAYANVGEFTSSVADYERALEHYDAALGVCEQNKNIEKQTMIQLNRGQALILIGSRSMDETTLRLAVDALTSSLELQQRDENFKRWIRTKTYLAHAMTQIGELTRSENALHEAVKIQSDLLKIPELKNEPSTLAIILDNLGQSLSNLGAVTQRAEYLTEAITTYHKCLEGKNKEEHALSWAKTQNNLGFAFWRLAVLEGRVDTLRESIVAFGHALEVETREETPDFWAGVQLSMARSYQTAWEHTRALEDLDLAVSGYQEFLQVRSKEADEQSWLEAQSGLGYLLLERGRRIHDLTAIRGALESLRAIQEATDKESQPLDWLNSKYRSGLALSLLAEQTQDSVQMRKGVADLSEALELADEYLQPDARLKVQIQMTLGEALSKLGEQEGDILSLSRSLTHTKAVLEAYGKDADPGLWAAASECAGRTLSTMGAGTGSAETMRKSIQMYKQALEARSADEGPVEMALCLTNLGVVQANLAELTRDPKVLKEAISSYRSAAVLFEQQSSTEYWLTVQMKLSHALQALGLYEQDPSAWQQSIEIDRALLDVWQSSNRFQNWASTQSHLAKTFHYLFLGSKNQDWLEHSISAVRAALTVWNIENAPADWAQAKFDLGSKLIELANVSSFEDSSVLDEATEAFHEALKIYSKEKSPEKHFEVLEQLGTAFCYQGIIENDAEKVAACVPCFRSALEFWEDKGSRADVHRLKDYLANALSDLGQRKLDVEPIIEAIEIFQDTLHGLPEEVSPLYLATAKLNLGLALRGHALLKSNRESANNAKKYLNEAKDYYLAADDADQVQYLDSLLADLKEGSAGS